MIKRKILLIAVAALLVSAGSVFAAEKTVERDDGERQLALSALTMMSSYLRSLDRFRIDANISKDEVLLNGQKLQFDSTVEMTVRPPHLLFAQVSTASTKRQYFYDGKQFTLYTPILNYYASFNAPDTLGKTVRLAEDKLDVNLPLADLFFWGTDEAGFDAIEDARVIGVGMVNGVSCNHFAFQQSDVDWQICIKRGGNPLPLKLVITTKTEAEQPQYVATIKWDTAPSLVGTEFSFKPRKDDHRIKFAGGNEQ